MLDDGEAETGLALAFEPSPDPSTPTRPRHLSYARVQDPALVPTHLGRRVRPHGGEPRLLRLLLCDPRRRGLLVLRAVVKVAVVVVSGAGGGAYGGDGGSGVSARCECASMEGLVHP